MGAQPARVRMATGRCLALTVAPCVSTFPAAHRFLLTRRGGWLATTAASSADSFVYSTPTRRYQQEEQEEQEQGKLRKTKRDAPRGSKKCDSSANAPSDWERSMGGEGAA